MKKLLILLSLLFLLPVQALAQSPASGLFRREPLYRSKSILPKVNGSPSLGDSSHGWLNLSLSNGTNSASFSFDSGGYLKILASKSQFYLGASNSVDYIVDDSFFGPATSGTPSLGDSTHGWDSLHISDGTATAKLEIYSGSFLIGATSASAGILFVSQGSAEAWLTNLELKPYVNAGLSLGSSGAGFNALYLSDGTETFSIAFNSTVPELLTSDSYMKFGAGGAGSLMLSTSALYSVSNGGLSLGISGSAFKALYLYETGTLPTCDAEGEIALDNDSNCDGTTANGALCICDGSTWQTVVSW